MPKRPNRVPVDENPFATPKPRKSIPHEFVLEALAPLSPWTRPLFSCLAIYVGNKIVVALRDRPRFPAVNGVWIATTEEHHATLQREFPNMKSISALGPGITGWQILTADAPDFEDAALHLCDLILAGDPRIGKIPKAKSPKARSPKVRSKKHKPAKTTPRKT